MSIDASQYDCHEINELMFDYVEQNLTNDIRLAIQYHFMMCPACAQRLEEYRASMQTAQKVLQAEKPALPKNLSDQLVSFLESEGSESD